MPIEELTHCTDAPFTTDTIYAGLQLQPIAIPLLLVVSLSKGMEVSPQYTGSVSRCSVAMSS
jgi:hypothetical protein